MKRRLTMMRSKLSIVIAALARIEWEALAA